MRTRRAFDLSLYLVTDPHLTAQFGLVETALAAAKGGATMVQLRDPHARGRVLVEQGRALVAALRPLGIPVIVNDRADVAVACHADGVHVGQTDIDAADVRRLIGPERILGLSITLAAQMAKVDTDVVDYFGVGPIYPVDPATKPDAATPLGPEGLRALRQLTTLPVVAIGGITAERLPAVMATGVQGCAVVSAICGKTSPELSASKLAEMISSAKTRHL